MLEQSVHANNPSHRMVCSDCHDAHSLYQGPPSRAAASDEGTYEFHTPTLRDNTLCLSCHAASGPYADLAKEEVAIAFLDAGGEVDLDGAALAAADYDAAQILAARTAIARAVGDHMQDQVGMGAAFYAPLDDALPVGRCSSCHMARTAKSGNYTTGLDASGSTALVMGDQGSHVFDVVWPAGAAALWEPGVADTAIMPNACGRCHAGSRLSGD